MFDQIKAGEFQRISTTLPLPIYKKLVKELRPNFSRASEGKLDRGIMSDWILEQALNFLNLGSKQAIMEEFLITKNLVKEFEEFFIARSEEKLNTLVASDSEA